MCSYARVHPLRNVIETVFWRLTEIIQLPFIPSLAHIFREHVLDAISIPMNQVNFHKLVKMCNDVEFQAWNVICNNFLSRHTINNVVYTDNISATKVMTLYRFSEKSEKTIGIETLISQILSNGLVDPFTNSPTSWETLLKLNTFYGHV